MTAVLGDATAEQNDSSRLADTLTVLQRRRRPPVRAREASAGKYNSDGALTGRQAIRSTATRHLQRIQEFILSLANPDRDGRILLTAERVPLSTSGNGASSTTVRTDVSLKYMLLAPSESFREVAEEAGALILAGGTMAPVR